MTYHVLRPHLYLPSAVGGEGGGGDSFIQRSSPQQFDLYFNRSEFGINDDFAFDFSKQAPFHILYHTTDFFNISTFYSTLRVQIEANQRKSFVMSPGLNF